MSGYGFANTDDILVLRDFCYNTSMPGAGVYGEPGMGALHYQIRGVAWDGLLSQEGGANDEGFIHYRQNHGDSDRS